MVINAFTLLTNPRLIFGAGQFKLLPSLIKQKGNTVLIVTGKSSLQKTGRLEALENGLKKEELKYFIYTVAGEPSPDIVDKAVSEFKPKGVDVIASVGGGSVLDAGKAISAMFPQDGSIEDYMEGIGTQTYNGLKIPFIAVPTTAGTGSESTKNTVLSKVGPNGYKKSLRHDNLVPDIALVDPELMLNTPFSIAVASGMDAFTQLLEPYVSPQASILTDIFALSGMEAMKDAIVPVCLNTPDNLDLWRQMAYGAYLSGITLANAGLGVIHAFSSAIGGYFNIPHGVICGTLLSVSVEKNIEALRQIENEYMLDRYARVGWLLEDKVYKADKQMRNEGCEILIKKLHDWTDKLQLPKLGQYGIKKEDLDKILHITQNRSNPVNLTKDDMREILIRRL